MKMTRRLPVLAIYVVVCERGTIFQWKVIIIIIDERSFFSIKNGI